MKHVPVRVILYEVIEGKSYKMETESKGGEGASSAVRRSSSSDRSVSSRERLERRRKRREALRRRERSSSSSSAGSAYSRRGGSRGVGSGVVTSREGRDHGVRRGGESESGSGRRERGRTGPGSRRGHSPRRRSYSPRRRGSREGRRSSYGERDRDRDRERGRRRVRSRSHGRSRQDTSRRRRSRSRGQRDRRGGDRRGARYSAEKERYRENTNKRANALRSILRSEGGPHPLDPFKGDDVFQVTRGKSKADTVDSWQHDRFFELPDELGRDKVATGESDKSK